MECEQYKPLFTDYINKDISAAQKAAMDKHLAGCPDCAEELKGMEVLWGMMGTVETPEPSAHLKVKFQAMLNTYKDEIAEKKGFWQNLRDEASRLWQTQPQWPMAYNLVMLAFFLGGGFLYLHSGKTDAQNQQLQALNEQVHELKQTMMLSLLENPSASERIRGCELYTGD